MRRAPAELTLRPCDAVLRAEETTMIYSRSAQPQFLHRERARECVQCQGPSPSSLEQRLASHLSPRGHQFTSCTRASILPLSLTTHTPPTSLAEPISGSGSSADPWTSAADSREQQEIRLLTLHLLSSGPSPPRPTTSELGPSRRSRSSSSHRSRRSLVLAR